MSPTRSPLLTDAGFVLLLAACALAGLGPSFEGRAHLLVGLAGVGVGLAAAAVAVLRDWPRVTVVAVVAAAYLVLGVPVALWSADPAGVVVLARQLVDGWKGLLTTLPPVAGRGPVLALPWALGLATGSAGLLLAAVRGGGRRWDPVLPVLPLLPPLALLGAVILLGVDTPASVRVQGVALGCLALLWLAVRSARPEDGRVLVRRDGGRPWGPRPWLRAGAGAALVALAGVLAVPVGTAALGGDEGREHLRRHVQPPFDVAEYPSPLASFRRYVEPADGAGDDPVNLYGTRLLTADGLPAGTRLRFAALDEYDGVVWGASDDGAGRPADPDDSRFRRVSTAIRNPARGSRVRGSVTLGPGWDLPWLPTAGAVQGVEFVSDEPALDARQQSLRYNTDTDTAVVPAGLGEGDRYRLAAVLPPDALGRGTEAWSSAPDPQVWEAGAFLDSQRIDWVGDSPSRMTQVLAVARRLRSEGRYSDGVAADERMYHPGHNVARLAGGFVNAPVMAGNDEQYAAVMALMANRIGVPARVVLGAVLPGDGEVTGEDVQAWVELRALDGSWRTLPTEEFVPTTSPAEQPPRLERQVDGQVVPPAAPVPPPSTLDDLDDSELGTRKVAGEGDPGFRFPDWAVRLLLYGGLPLLLVALLLCSVVAVKSARRRRRRTHPRASARIAGAWRELVDHARDLGVVVPRGTSTRLLQSHALGDGAGRLARAADAHVFGPLAPAEEAASAYWADVDAERAAMSGRVGRWRRLRAAVALASLRTGGAR